MTGSCKWYLYYIMSGRECQGTPGERMRGKIKSFRRPFSKGILTCLTPCPLSLAKEEGVPPRHPAVHLAANGATPPLKGRGVFPKASHNIEAREALSVRCFPFYDNTTHKNFGKAGSLRSSFTTQCKTYVRILRKSFALLCAAPKNQKKNLKKFAFVTIL